MCEMPRPRALWGQSYFLPPKRIFPGYQPPSFLPPPPRLLLMLATFAASLPCSACGTMGCDSAVRIPDDDPSEEPCDDEPPSSDRGTGVATTMGSPGRGSSTGAGGGCLSSKDRCCCWWWRCGGGDGGDGAQPIKLTVQCRSFFEKEGRFIYTRLTVC